MVKRIKKRIEKQDEDLDTEGSLDGEAPPPDLGAELQSLAEDDFTRRIASGFQWVIEKRVLLAGMAGLIIVGAIAWSVMARSGISNVQEASAAFYDAARTYIQATEDEAPAAGDAAKKASLTPEERRKRIEQASGGFATARSTYAERPVAQLATLGYAGAQLDLGKADEAAKLYGEVAGRSEADALIRAVALQGLAAALEAKGDRAGAREAWTKLGDIDRAAYGLMGGLQVGRLLEIEGKGNDARALYEKLQKEFDATLSDFSGRGYKAEIERRLAAFGDAT